MSFKTSGICLAVIIASAAMASASAQTSNDKTPDNVPVQGNAPAISMGNLEQDTDQALGNAAHNATAAQFDTNVTAQAATTMGVSSLYETDPASAGKAEDAIFDPTPIECKIPSPVPLPECGPSGPPINFPN